MNFTSSGSAKAILAVERVQELYDRNLFLDAFAQTAEYWKPSIHLEDLSVAELVLGGRLASRLGSSRLSRQLFKAAVKRAPSDPAARYFSSYLVARHRNYFHMLRAFEAEPEFEGADAEIQSSRLAYHAMLYASLRDFKQAHLYISRARKHKARDSWVLSCESDVFGYEDRWVEALESAEQAWSISPGTTYAARSLAGSLLNLRRVEEAAERMAIAAENGQSHEIATLACWYLCALAETRDGNERIEILNRAKKVADRLESLAPLADRETRRNFALTRLDIAEMSDDREGIERWAAEGRSPFHRKMLENFRANPQGKRIRLPFRRAIQKHNACLPTSLSSALASSNVHIDPDTMAAEITFGGTREWAAAEWLEKRGLVARFFSVTPDIAAKLIQNGIAFVMTLEWDFSAHAVAAVGLDEAAGTLIIHDPESFRSTEYLLESIGQGQSPLGPLGTVIVPPEKAALVDQLLPAENTTTMSLQQSYRRETFLHGVTAARSILELAITHYPVHPLTQSMQAHQDLEEGQTGKALAHYQQLAVAYPNAAYVRSNLLASCRSMQNTALMRAILADVVERGVLPGVESQKVWTYPPPNYAIEYADLLRGSDETLGEARSIIHTVIRRQPSYGPAWHVLADLLWLQHDIEGALFAYRVASCLNESNEHYATAFCDAQLEAGREEEGLQWLETRVRTYGSSPHAVATWVTWISSLEGLGHPGRALAASAEGLAKHPESPELLAFVVPFQARMGHWDEAEALLSRLEKSGNLALFREAAVAFYKMRGDLEQSIQQAEQWVTELPLSMQARDELVLLIAKRDGVDAGAALAKKWMAEHPGHDHMEDLYYRQLERAGASRGQKYSVLRRRVKRNPEDAWAWREMGFYCLRQYDIADEKHRARTKRRMENLIAQCDRTSPGNVSTLYLHAEWQQAQGEWAEALDLWMDAIAHAPKTLYGYEHAWDCVSHLDAAKRKEVWERMQTLFLGSTGRLQIARNLILMAAKRFGVAAAEQVIAHWTKTRPDDPGAIEAYADLLLEHGHGRTDFERALAMIGPAVEGFPYDSGLRFSQADALRKLSKFQEAEDVLNEIARRHPDDSSAQIQLARVQDRRGQIEEALQRMDAAIRRDPQNTKLFEVKIEILMSARRFKEAVAVINAALQNFPRVVHWRERSIQLLLDCEDAEAAVEAARGGIVVYPDGAYLWLLLGRTLYDHRRFAAQGEIESILRKSLALNPGLYETADYLAMLLVEQYRYEEAEGLMHQIVNRLDDPSPALGRVAWIHREEGKKRQALTEMTALMTDFPSYRWGWNVFIAWLEEDKEWGTARQFLAEIPPEVRTDVRFCQKRLLLLDKAGFTDDKLNSEWTALLADFPEEIPLHLLRYDFLHERKLVFDAIGVLEKIRPLEPDNPYLLARMAEALMEIGNKKEAIETLVSLFFAPAEPSVWPPNYAWQAIRKANCEADAYAQARAKLATGARPTLRSASIFAEYAFERNVTEKRTKQRIWRQWFPDAGAREVLGLLKTLDANEENARPLRSAFFQELNDFGYPSLVARYWKKHRAQVESDTRTWAETGRALTSLKRRKAARELLGQWRNRSGVHMWNITNFVTCYSPFRGKQLREMAATCHDALGGLPHDHCARFLAHVEAESYALLGDKKAFLELWQRYQATYFTGAIKEGEWFQNARRNLLHDIPVMAGYLEKEQWFKFRMLRWRWLWRHGAPKMPAIRRSQVNSNISIRWIIWLLWILLMLARFAANRGP
jgi:predicted Zn-dependent protease